MYVKICGLTSPEAAVDVVDAGADAIGMVFSPTSSRNIDVDVARSICSSVGDRADRVIVVNRMPATDAAELALAVGADVVQLHGSAYDRAEVAAARAVLSRVWQASSWAHFDGREVGSWGEEALLLDAPDPGSGVSWDLSPLRDGAPRGRWLLAGGLFPDTVAAAVAAARPFGVDVSSGVESAPGVKDPERVRAFIAAARS